MTKYKTAKHKFEKRNPVDREHDKLQKVKVQIWQNTKGLNMNVTKFKKTKQKYDIL